MEKWINHRRWMEYMRNDSEEHGQMKNTGKIFVQLSFE